jgi:hypothetical protein
MERGAINTLRDIGVQILVLDEIHNILARSWREQRIVLNTLRFLSNELKLSLVCFGIMEARDAINGDVQLARRFCVGVVYTPERSIAGHPLVTDRDQ